MIPTKTPRLFGAITAALAGALMLAGCTGGGAGSAEPGTTTSPSTTAEPSFYTARVIDVLSGDTLRVQMETGVYHPSDSTTGEREEVEVPSQTIVVKDPSFDAPTTGECGFEESRSYLVTGVLGQKGPEWVLEEDSNVIVELSREDIETLPETEGKAELYSINYRNNPASVMLQRGYAQVGELVPAEEGTNTRYSQLNAWQDAGKRTAENNLWGSCWSE